MSGVYDAAILGGGFFGCEIARHLRERGLRVVLLEERTDLLLRASYHNQARVHHGYQYLQHAPTAQRSANHFGRFLADYADCCDRGLTQFYAIAREASRVQAGYFDAFCRQTGIPCRRAPLSVQGLFDRDLIEAVFEVEEYAFDASLLRSRLWRQLVEARVEVRCGTHVRKVKPGQAARLALELEWGPDRDTIEANHVFNCTYAQLNHVRLDSGLEPLPMKQELTELALIEPPEALRNLGITVLSGPFFSCLPFPAERLHSLSHARYSSHFSWQESKEHRAPAVSFDSGPSNYVWMIRDARRFLPLLEEARFVRSIFEVKAIPCEREESEDRSLVFHPDHGLPGLHTVLGEKFDTIYDVFEALSHFLAEPRSAA